MKTSERGKKLFAEWEGIRHQVYLDSGGCPTIGIGHLLTRSERLSGKIAIGGKLGDYREGLTEQQCWDLLEEDLAWAERAVNDLVRFPLNQNQFDALVSFVSNVGRRAFADSTLLKLLNQGYYESVPTQLSRWNRDNGFVVAGLTNRRNKEIALWNEA